ncbi:MAG TPA: SDR family oxidoreductase, partial [Acidimicrobiales bacterium]|nr:SDR family oxidoreductase [Acidimicrobiales bacterium]
MVVRAIPVACAFHSPVVAAAGPAFAETLLSCPIASPAYPVWSNTTAREHDGAAPDSIRAVLARQVAEPVRFVEQIRAMYDAGARVFVECGPGRVLTGLVGKTLADRPHTAVACEVSGEPGLPRFLSALAELAVAGVAMDVTPLFTGRELRTVSPEAVPARPGWVIDGHLTRTAAGDVLAGGLRPSAEFARRAPVPGDVPVPTTLVASGTAAHLTRPVDAGASGATGTDAAVLAYFQATREVIAAQRDVMLSYLGAPAGPPAAVQLAEAPRIENAPADDQPSPTPIGPQPLTEAALTEAILGIVSRRTGYPREMLGGGLDLEADLSIDSIKRTEIVMELIAELRAKGTPPPDGAVEALARLKTIGAIVEWMLAHDRVRTKVGAAHAAGVDGSPSEAVVIGPPKRYRVEVVTQPGVAQERSAGLAGHRIVVVDDEGGVGVAVASALRHQGADAVLLGVHHDLEAACARTDGVIHLGALRLGDTPVLPAAFAPLRAALVGGARAVLMATGSGGRFGRGIHGAAVDSNSGLGVWGLARTMALEYPDAAVRAVDVDPSVEPERIARWLLAELGELGPSGESGQASPVVGYGMGGRSLLMAVPSELAGTPPSDRRAIGRAVEALGLGPDSVVLLTGGGRGITAGCAVALAEACGCRIELIGRSAVPEADERPSIASASDAAALRRALISETSQGRGGIGAPASVEAEVCRILASRKVRATLAAVSATGSPVRYHSVDVTDTAQVHRLVEDIFETWGRLDGVVHGAGVLEDRRIADKTPESFARVFSAKVDGARSLAAALGGRPPLRFLAMFGSIAGVFGNPGQVDYAAANDALDTLARSWARASERIAARSPAGAMASSADLLPAADEPDAADGHGVPPIVADRIVSIDWGPWAADADGMVSPELEREFARRGVAMIAPEEGIAALFGELAWGDPTDHQVLYVSGALDPFATPASGAATS